MTSDPTIDAIDHALDDWETSDDAMRWTTKADVKPAPVLQWPQALVTVNIDVEPLHRAFRNVVRAAAKVIEVFQFNAAKITLLMAALEQQETTMRRAHMHTAYRQRKLSRRRRNRRRR